MQIELKEVAKKFNREWIFKDVNLKIEINQPLAIVGNNGSGKSTLLQLIASLTYCTEGTIAYQFNGQAIHPDQIYQHLSFAGPYQELMEELSLIEHVKFHLKFKKFRNNSSAEEFLKIINLEKQADKFIYQFSSGMKQRLKLGLAILTDTPVLLLDEPVSNLDNETITWYRNLLSNNANNRIVIISSNHNADEIFICNKQLDIRDYKKS